MAAMSTVPARPAAIASILEDHSRIPAIAAELALSVKTVGTYRSRVLEKLGLHNNASLVKYVIDQQLQ